jgi:hypothetical protein
MRNNQRQETKLTGKIFSIRENEQPSDGEVIAVWLDNEGPFIGVVVRPRKMWVEIDDYFGRFFTADENSITKWSRVSVL